MASISFLSIQTSRKVDHEISLTSWDFYRDAALRCTATTGLISMSSSFNLPRQHSKVAATWCGSRCQAPAIPGDMKLSCQPFGLPASFHHNQRSLVHLHNIIHIICILPLALSPAFRRQQLEAFSWLPLLPHQNLPYSNRTCCLS